MFQVTALYQDSEIGFGEGDSYEFAMQECIDSIDSFYSSVEDEIVLEATKEGNIAKICTPLSVYNMFK